MFAVFSFFKIFLLLNNYNLLPNIYIYIYGQHQAAAVCFELLECNIQSDHVCCVLPRLVIHADKWYIMGSKV